MLIRSRDEAPAVKWNKTPSTRAAIANPQLWGSSSIFLCALPLPTGGINSKHISEAFVGTIYGEAERTYVMSNILGTGFFYFV